MKILHISSALTWRGGEQQIAYLVEGLHKMQAEQFVFCPEGSPLASWCQTHQWPHETYPKANLSPKVVRQLIRLVKRIQPDLIHLHDSHAHTYGVLANTFSEHKTPLVLHRRVDFPIKPNIFSRWKYNHASIKTIMCVSEFIRQLLLPDIRRKEIVHTVYSGIDLDRFGSPKDPAKGLRSTFNVPEDHLIIANIASLAPHKDYYTFVNVIKVLKQAGIRATYFAIGGDGGEMAQVKAYAIRAGMSDELIFTGFRPDVADLAQDIDILLVTSKEEGLCTTILDAFSGGIPVVGTMAGGIPELVKNEETGLTAPIKNAEELAGQVIRMLDDQTLRDRCITNAKKFVRQFGFDSMTSQVFHHYMNILGHP
ncbi:MAG: glycosyltransferase family 4 protein [Saprospiraceae bacterium]|nr:glycosyltransferase family 4 protein [Saprospiraceae bacterium]MCB9317896.1 glycosyltransferase family 4 protein [Lewinellaceae bacterium]